MTNEAADILKKAKERWYESHGVAMGHLYKGRKLVATFSSSESDDCRDELAEVVRACNSHDELLAALKLWKRFFDEMPKGQFSKISCDIGIMNDAFIATDRAIALAEAGNA